MSGVFLRAQWRHLAVLNFEIDPQILAPLIPRGVELDDFNGRTLVSLVAFEFAGARLLGVPIPFHQLFPEINLRCYVRRRVNDSIRRGVFFLKEIVPKRAVTFVANHMFNESFTLARMSHSINDTEVNYQARVGGQRVRLMMTKTGEPSFASIDSVECFVLEHYYAYNVSRAGKTLEFQVEHPRWKICPVKVDTFNIDADQLYGTSLAQAFRHPSTSAFLADGSEVCVHRGVDIIPDHAAADHVHRAQGGKPHGRCAHRQGDVFQNRPNDLLPRPELSQFEGKRI